VDHLSGALNRNVAPVGLGSGLNALNGIRNINVFRPVRKAQFVPEPNPIKALAGPGTPGLGLPSTHSYSYGFQSSPGPNRTCPQPYSGILVQHCG